MAKNANTGIWYALTAGGDDQSTIAAGTFTKPGVRGVMQKIAWSSIETTTSAYDFSSIHAHLSAAVDEGLEYMVMIKDREFTLDDPVPGYLDIEDPGNVHSDITAGNTSYTGVRWQAYYQERFKALIRAIASEFDSHPSFNGIALQETAMGFSAPQELAYNYTVNTFVSAMRGYYEVGGSALVSSNFYAYINFVSGGMNSTYDAVTKLASAAVDNGAIPAGPDMKFGDASLEGQYRAYPALRLFSASPTGNSIQNNSYSWTSATGGYDAPDGGHYWCVNDMLDRGRNWLGINVVWLNHTVTRASSESYIWSDPPTVNAVEHWAPIYNNAVSASVSAAFTAETLGGGKFYGDNNRWVRNSNGILNDVAYISANAYIRNVPRYQYDTSASACLGIEIQGGGDNLIANNTTLLSSDGFTYTNISSASAAASILSGEVAIELSEGTGTGNHHIIRDFEVSANDISANTPIHAWALLEYRDCPYAKISLRDTNGDYVVARYNIQDGTSAYRPFADGNCLAVGMEPYGSAENTVYLCRVVAGSKAGAVDPVIQVGMVNAAGSANSYTGTSRSMVVHAVGAGRGWWPHIIKTSSTMDSVAADRLSYYNPGLENDFQVDVSFIGSNMFITSAGVSVPDTYLVDYGNLHVKRRDDVVVCEFGGNSAEVAITTDGGKIESGARYDVTVKKESTGLKLIVNSETTAEETSAAWQANISAADVYIGGPATSATSTVDFDAYANVTFLNLGVNSLLAASATATATASSGGAVQYSSDFAGETAGDASVSAGGVRWFRASNGLLSRSTPRYEYDISASGVYGIALQGSATNYVLHNTTLLSSDGWNYVSVTSASAAASIFSGELALEIAEGTGSGGHRISTDAAMFQGVAADIPSDTAICTWALLEYRDSPYVAINFKTKDNDTIGARYNIQAGTSAYIPAWTSGEWYAIGCEEYGSAENTVYLCYSVVNTGTGATDPTVQVGMMNASGSATGYVGTDRTLVIHGVGSNLGHYPQIIKTSASSESAASETASYPNPSVTNGIDAQITFVGQDLNLFSASVSIPEMMLMDCGDFHVRRTNAAVVVDFNGQSARVNITTDGGKIATGTEYAVNVTKSTAGLVLAVNSETTTSVGSAAWQADISADTIYIGGTQGDQDSYGNVWIKDFSFSAGTAAPPQNLLSATARLKFQTAINPGLPFYAGDLDVAGNGVNRPSGAFFYAGLYNPDPAGSFDGTDNLNRKRRRWRGKGRGI